MVPLTAEHPDRTRQRVALALERPHPGSPLPSVWSGAPHALRPLVPKRLGPGGELLVTPLAIGLDRTKHVPALPAAPWQEPIGGLPPGEEHRDLDPGRQTLLQACEPVAGSARFLAKAEPRLGSPLSLETPHGVVAEGEPPSIRIGPSTKCEADFDMDGAVGVARVLLALTLAMVVVRCNRFEMTCALVFFTSGVLQAHRERPRVDWGGGGDQGRDGKAADRGSQGVGRPGTDAETVRPLGGIWRIDEEAIQARAGFLSCLRHHEGISYTKDMRPWRLGESEV
jgi:hypothetical protein